MNDHLSFTVLCLFRGEIPGGELRALPRMNTVDITFYLRKHGYDRLREWDVEKFLHLSMDEERRQRAMIPKWEVEIRREL